MMAAADQAFRVPMHVRFLEVDQQGVVFHMWYLAYFEDARNQFLAAHGVDLPSLVASGCDLQVVHTEVDWRGSIGWSSSATVLVRPERVGTTSFTMGYEVDADGESLVQGRTVYVTVDRNGAKCALPKALRDILATELSGGTA